MDVSFLESVLAATGPFATDCVPHTTENTDTALELRTRGIAERLAELPEPAPRAPHRALLAPAVASSAGFVLTAVRDLRRTMAVTDPYRPATPPGTDERDIERRAALSDVLGKEAWPGLPGRQQYTDVQDVARALGYGHRARADLTCPR